MSTFPIARTKRPASGAFTTLRGSLTEYSWNGSVHVRTLVQGNGRHFDASHIHDVVNEGRGDLW